MAVELWDHQKKVLPLIHNGCILWGGTGSGKSLTAMAYFHDRVCGIDGLKIREKRDLYIITTAKKRDTLDWDAEASLYGIGKETSVHDIGFVVDSWNNIQRYVGVEDAFFIFDEQRVIGSGVWVKSFLKIAKHNQWILLSATPGDTWMDYVPVFIANGFYKNKTEFLNAHVTFKRFQKYPIIDRYIGTKTLERRRSEVLVEMPMHRHTTRHEVELPVVYDRAKYSQLIRTRFNPWTDMPMKDAGELYRSLRTVINSDPSREEAIVNLLTAYEHCIIFYSYSYELDILRQASWRAKVPIFELNGQNHDALPENGAWVYLVQYQAGAEAWNCITSNVIIFYSLNPSFRKMEQAKGRIDRANTPFDDLYYFILMAESPIEQANFESLRAKTDFNEQKWAKNVWEN